MQTLLALRPPQLTSEMIQRGILAGLVWGVMLAAGLVGLALYQCGGVCIADIAQTTLLSMVAGIVTIGSLVMFSAHRAQ